MAKDLKTVYMTGCTVDVIGPHGVLENRGFYLPRPFGRTELFKPLENAFSDATNRQITLARGQSGVFTRGCLRASINYAKTPPP